MCQKPAGNTNSGKQNKEIYCQQIALASQYTAHLHVSAIVCCHLQGVSVITDKNNDV